MKLRRFAVACLLLLFAVQVASFYAPTTQANPTSLPQLEIVGTNIQYTNGTQLVLRGVNVGSRAWWHNDYIDQTEVGYIGSWNANVIFISWKGETPEDSTPRWDEQAFKDKLENIVEWCAQEGIYTVIKCKPYATTSDLGHWSQTNWNNWISDLRETAALFVSKGLETNILYQPITEPEGISVSTFQTWMRQAIDEVRAEDPDAPFVIQALDMYGGIGLFTEQDYPINRNNTGFEYHDHWWRTNRPTTKESIRARQQDRGATWCLQNNRAVFCGDFNYDANLGVADDGGTGQLWLTNFLEVMEEDGFAGWAHWSWHTPSINDMWAEITTWGTGNPTTQGAIIQPFLNLNTQVTPEQQPSGVPFEDSFEPQDFGKWNKTDTSTAVGGTFGYTSVGSGYENGLSTDIIGSVFNATENATINSITWYGSGKDTGSGYVKCAIYKHSDLSLVGETEKLAIGSTIQWNTHSFSTPPSVVENTEYILVAWFERSTARFYRDTGITDVGHRKNDQGAPDGFPDPLVNPDHNNRKFSIYANYNTTGDASYGISSTSYLGSYSANFTTSIADNAYVYAEVYFTDTYEYLNLRSWVYFDSLPDSGDGLSIMQYLNSNGDWIGDVQYIREANGTYRWKVIVYNAGGNLEYTNDQTLTVQTWNNVEFWLNITGQVNLWVNETEKISQTGDYNDRGQIKKIQIRLENVGEQGADKTVLHDYVRIDDERIYSQTAILFFSSYALDEYGELASLGNVKVNGTSTDVNGTYSWGNLTYNQVYEFAIEKPDGYYPAWVLGSDSLSWNGTHFTVTYNLTDANHYITPVFHSSSQQYIKSSTAHLLSTMIENNAMTAVASETGSKTIQVYTDTRPTYLLGCSYSQSDYASNVFTITHTFNGSKTFTLSWENFEGVQIYSTTGELSQPSYVNATDTLTFTANGTSLTEVYCGSKQRPTYLVGKAYVSSDYASNMFNVTENFSGNQTFVLSWQDFDGIKINSTTGELLSSPTYANSIFTLSINDTSTTTVYCGTKGRPTYVTGKPYNASDYNSDIFTVTDNFSGSQTFTLSWETFGGIAVYSTTGEVSATPTYVDDTFTFTIDKASGSSVTEIYVGGKGEPTHVRGATGWSYNTSTQIVTFSVQHSSEEEGEIDWTIYVTPLPDIGLDPLWQNLLSLDLLGFITGAYTSLIGQLFYGIIIMIASVVLYIRTQSALFVSILWTLLGSLFIVAMPIISPLAMFLIALGIAGLLWKLFTSLR